MFRSWFIPEHLHMLALVRQGFWNARAELVTNTHQFHKLLFSVYRHIQLDCRITGERTADGIIGDIKMEKLRFIWICNMPAFLCFRCRAEYELVLFLLGLLGYAHPPGIRLACCIQPSSSTWMLHEEKFRLSGIIRMHPSSGWLTDWDFKVYCSR